MKKLQIQTALLLAGMLGTCSIPLKAANADPNSNQTEMETPCPWSFDIVPYLWLATYNGSFDLPGSRAGFGPTRTSSGDAYSSRISGAAMLLGQVRYREFGLYLDGAWVQLRTGGDNSSALYSATEIKTDIAYGTAAASYRLPLLVRDLDIDLLAGARVWHVGNTIERTSGILPGYSTDGSHTWCDPIVGAKLRYDFGKHWFAVALGDAGGFGAGSDLSWNVFGGVGYQFTSCVSATLGYRYMHLDYEKNSFVVDANIQGALLGVGFHF